MLIVRVVTVYEPAVDALPSELRETMTEQDEAAVRTGREFFAALAPPDAMSWLRRVLAACAEDGFELQFLSAGDRPFRPFYRLHGLGGAAVSLPRPVPPRDDLPAFLRTVYGVIGSFCENDFDEAGGLHPGDALRTVAETGIWAEPGDPISPATAVPFLETYSGTQLCYLPGGHGAWLAAGRFRPVESLEREVERYFEPLLAGTRT